MLPPDVNESWREFAAVDAKRIRFGLSAVRNVGDGAIEAIIAARAEHPFVSLEDFCERVDSSVLNKRALESLIKAGAFDSLGASRKYLLTIFEQAADAGVKRRRDAESGQFSLFGGASEDAKPVAPALPPAAAEELPKPDLLSYEKEMLGLYVSDNPLLELAPLLQTQTTSIAQARELRDGATVSIGGLVGKISRITTRKGESMAFVVIEDLEGSMEVVVFPAVLQKYRALVVEDAVVKIKGRLDVKEDEVKLIAQELTALKENAAAAPAPALYLKIGNDRLDKDLIGKIRQVLKAHPGDAEVFLRLNDGDKLTTLRFSTDFRVAGSGPLIGELSGLLGDGSVTVA